PQGLAQGLAGGRPVLRQADEIAGQTGDALQGDEGRPRGGARFHVRRLQGGRRREIFLPRQAAPRRDAVAGHGGDGVEAARQDRGRPLRQAVTRRSPRKTTRKRSWRKPALHLGTFKVRGQGGHFGPMNVYAYRVLRIPDHAKTFTANETVDPSDVPDLG